jgi:hypothetical protein
MRKTKRLLIIAFTLAALTSAALNQIHTAAAQGLEPVGVVVAYIPGQSITIVDQSGNQHEYMISPSVRILPPPRADSLRVGSFVTIIAPASLGKGKETAVGIVVHPQVPPGWNRALSATPLVSNPAAGTATGTSTATATPTGFANAAATETPTAFGTATDTSTPTATPVGGGTTITTNTLIDFIRSLLRQLLGSSK